MRDVRFPSALPRRLTAGRAIVPVDDCSPVGNRTLTVLARPASLIRNEARPGRTLQHAAVHSEPS